MTNESLKIINEIDNFFSDMNHKVLIKGTMAHLNHLEKTLKKCNYIEEKYFKKYNIELRDERNFLYESIRDFNKNKK